MRPESFADRNERVSDIQFPKVENREAQRPSETELPELKHIETEQTFCESFDSERPTEELPHVETDRNEFGRNCPIENGTWEDERGNSKWIPDSDYVPQKKNPEQKKWKEILNEFKIDGIDFKDGEPDFGEVSKGNVEIESFSISRDDNFDKADMELAKQKGCTPEEVEKWRKGNSYTWHECRDMRTMQKVPSMVHNNVSHRGGISEAKGGI